MNQVDALNIKRRATRSNTKRAIVPKTKRVTTRYIALPDGDGLTMPVTVVGVGQPLVLVHAFGMDAREFLPFVLPLAGKYQIFLPHLRGFGLAKGNNTTEFDFLGQYAQDVNALIESICFRRGVDSIPVMAISMGAQVMWSYFTRYGSNRVSRYLNIDQTPTVHNQDGWEGGLFGGRQNEIFGLFGDLLEARKEHDHIEFFVDLPHALKRKTIETERLFSLMSVGRSRSEMFVKVKTRQPDKKLATFTHYHWQQKMRCLQAYLELPYDFRETAENLPIPVVNMIGGRSQLYGLDWQTKTTQMIPNATEIVFPKAGHAIPLDEPIGFYKAIKAFLPAS